MTHLELDYALLAQDTFASLLELL